MQPIGGGPQPSYEQLLAENRKLKQQLNGIHINPGQDQVSLRGLQSDDLKIDELQVKMPGLGKLVPEFLNVSTLSNPNGTVQLPDLSRFARFPMQVQTIDMSLNEKAINKVLSRQKVEGMSGLHLQIGEGGKLKLSGIANKLIDVSFEVQGRVSAAGGTKMRFDLDKTKVGGWLPVPKLMTNLFASLAANEMARMSVKQEEDGAFVIDMKGYLPPNIGLTIDDVRTAPGVIQVRGGR
ncbi:MAG: hypothetical protein KF760_17670 [Candidatus Eremiobacteraeota bacterium]|nr:hypothetical protein [Candidatus Eremiobacteraeota bacterium]MCW5867934.1 hypothetical protein [Candidatus Eremiobacteraeota bacterium]